MTRPAVGLLFLALAAPAFGDAGSLEAFLDELWIAHGVEWRPCSEEVPLDGVELCGRARRDVAALGATIHDGLGLVRPEAGDERRVTVRTERWGRDLRVEANLRKGRVRLTFTPALPECGDDPRIARIDAHEDSPRYEAPVQDPAHRAYPEYPARARIRRAEGRVDVIATIDREGNVRDICLLSVTGRGLGFEAAKFEAMRRWRYRPARLDGRVVAVPVRAYSTFDLR